MHIASFIRRFSGLAILLLTMLAVPAASTGAQGQTGNSSIEVHNRICPPDYEGQDYFEDCHDSIPDPGLPFSFSDGVTRDGATNENGNVGFANLPAGTYTITGGAPGEFTNYAVFCSIGTEAESNRQQVDVNYVTGGIQFDLAEDTNVICDWYTIPMSQGEQPVPTDTTTGNSSLEVHNRICPEGYQGQDFFNDCHDTAPDPGLTFTFSNGETHEGTTNENGNIGFANLPAGTYTITGGVPGEFANTVVYCAVGTEAESNQQQVNVTDVTGGIQLDLPADTNIICDWYNIPENLKGDVTPTIVPTEIPPTQVPPTATIPAEPGRMVDIREGVCMPDQLDSTAIELTDLRAPEQEGSDDANVVIAETSTSTVSMSLDELTNGTNVLVAYAENGNADPVACTELAGPVNANGELVLGLQEMDDSGYSGIVYLIPASDSSQTNISVFLAEGLSDESGPSTPTP